MIQFRWGQPTFQAFLVQRFVAAAVLSVAGVTLIGARVAGDYLGRDARQRLRESALRVRDSMENHVTLHRDAVEAVSVRLGRRTVKAESGPPDRVAAEVIEEVAAVHPGFLSLLVADRDGQIVRAIRRNDPAERGAATQRRSVEDRSYFQIPRLTGRPYISGVFRGRGLGEDPIVAVSAPVLARDGAFAGVVEGSIDITRIPVTPVLLSHSPIVIVYDGEGRIVYSNHPERFAPLSLLEGRRELEGIGESGTFRLAGAADWLGSRRFESVRYPVRDTGWQVVAALSSEAVEAGIRELYWLVGGSLLVMVGLTWVVARGVARVTAQPIVALSQVMRRYELDEAAAAGSPAWESASGTVPREIMAIQEEFRTLAGRLRNSYLRLQMALEERDRSHDRMQEVLRSLDRVVGERTAQLAESEARYRHVVEQSGDLIYRTDAFGRITFHNAAFEALLGAGAVGRKMLDFIEPVTRRRVVDEARRQLRARTPAVYLEFAIVSGSGETRWIGQGTQLLVDPAGRPTGFQAIGRDITSRKVAELAFEEVEERYALVVQGSNNGVWDWDLRTGSAYFSERWSQMLGLEPSESVNQTIEAWLSRIHPTDAERVREELQAYAENGFDSFESEHRLRHADGTWRWVLTCGAAVRGPDGAALRIAGSATDLTAGKLVDALTGLPNRLAIMDRLDRLLARQQEDPDRKFALLFMDLDRFKLINDSLGHLKGDLLLLTVARRLAGALADCGPGCVGRLGGDEFVIVLDEAPTPEPAIRLAQAIQQEVSAPMHLDGSLILATLSIGIAHSRPDIRKAEDALRNADTAMYHAKSEGRGRYSLFDTSMHARAVARIEMETALVQALESGEFDLHYQPQVDLRTGRLSGFEALLRWQHPVRGTVYPDEFIPVVEENGLILPLGRWVIETGCRQLAEWTRSMEEARDISISINLSARQFSDPLLESSIVEILEQTGLDPSRLHLEVTESMVADDPETAQRTLVALARRGVRLEVDDFGTGYSCLSQLHQLPFDTLKVDRSFVMSLDRSGAPKEESGSIVESIVTLSSSLGISVVAEGIETERQWSRLAALGCEYGQGFHFAPPLPRQEASQLLRHRLRQPWETPAGDSSAVASGILQLHRQIGSAQPAQAPAPPALRSSEPAGE